MKQAAIFILSSFCLISAYSQDINTVISDENGNKKLLGKVNKTGLTKTPFTDWFTTNYVEYLENDKVIDSLKSGIKDYRIKVFFGSWCGDSKRELPRFYKVLEAAKYPMEQLEVIAVDRTITAYKQAPNGDEKGLNIHRVPTFIFYKNEKEVNRIVEYPVETLERDILNITSAKAYTPNYDAVQYLEKLILQKPLYSLYNEQSNIVNKISDLVEGRRELNTYGYVKLSAHQIEEAIFIFDLNAKIFPYKYQVFDSLGEAYFKANNYPEALKNYYKVLSLDTENENAKKMVLQINEASN